jgi:hypothetical protein
MLLRYLDRQVMKYYRAAPARKRRSRKYNAQMINIRLLALLSLLLTACETGPLYRVDVNLRIDSGPLQTRSLKLAPGRTDAAQILPGYMARTRLDKQTDDHVLASVALFRQADGASMGSLVSPPLDAGQAYDAYFVVCTDPPGTLVTGGLHGQVRLEDAPVRPSCMTPEHAP